VGTTGSRRRLGVVIVPDVEVSRELVGLRRALGCPSLASLVPHVTLVPPVNVHRDSMADAMALVRSVARRQPGALPLILGPAEVFTDAVEPGTDRVHDPGDPRSVLYLGVAGEGAAALPGLTAQLRTGPLERPDRHAFVPHLTLHEYLPSQHADDAVRALSNCHFETVVSDLVVLERTASPDWVQIMTVPLGEPVVRGRGGIAIEFRTTRTAGPEAVVLGMPAYLPVRRQATSPLPVWSDDQRFVEATVDGAVVGAARLQRSGRQWTVEECVTDEALDWASLPEQLQRQALEVARGLEADG
jgi:2'-5' RNA ligase